MTTMKKRVLINLFIDSNYDIKFLSQELGKERQFFIENRTIHFNLNSKDFVPKSIKNKMEYSTSQQSKNNDSNTVYNNPTDQKFLSQNRVDYKERNSEEILPQQKFLKGYNDDEEEIEVMGKYPEINNNNSISNKYGKFHSSTTNKSINSQTKQPDITNLTIDLNPQLKYQPPLPMGRYFVIKSVDEENIHKVNLTLLLSYLVNQIQNLVQYDKGQSKA